MAFPDTSLILIKGIFLARIKKIRQSFLELEFRADLKPLETFVASQPAELFLNPFFANQSILF